MRAEQRKWTPTLGWSSVPKGGNAPDVVLVFGAPAALADPTALLSLAQEYATKRIIGCSTAGEIDNVSVTDDGIVATALWFDHTPIETACVPITPDDSSETIGAALADRLPHQDLTHVMVFSDGLLVNGSALVDGMRRRLPANVAVTGGLAGDGARFGTTLVVHDGEAATGRVSALGFYGQRLRVGYGSLGGWDPFGPERLITASEGNRLLSLDNQPALALYKKYLGEHAKGLPATGLLFPLSLRTTDGRTFVRTILGVDDDSQSLTFAGDMPSGAYARLMKANFDRLVDGANGAARTSCLPLGGAAPEVAILISCVGRKLVLGQRTEEEVEAVRSVVGAAAMMTGFYSYGEISPAAPNASCELHNQTMTITTFAEC